MLKPIATLIFNLLFISTAFSQSGWEPYSTDKDKKPPPSDYLSETAEQIEHLITLLQNKYNQKNIGSICFIRKQQDAFNDKVIILQNGFFLLIFKTNDKIIHWVLVKVNSQKWLAMIESIVPSNSTQSLQMPKRSMRTEEGVALGILMGKVKSIYCPIQDEDIISALKNANVSSSISISELEKQSELAAQNKISKERKDMFSKGIPDVLRLIVFNNELYLVGKENSYIYFKVNPVFTGEMLLSYKRGIVSKGGIDVPNSCQSPAGCQYMTSKKEVIAHITNPEEGIKLPEGIKKTYSLNFNSADIKNSDVQAEGITLSNQNFDVITQLHACPPMLAYFNSTFQGFDKIDANTYLIDGSGNSSLNDWFIFTGKLCNKCEGMTSNFIAEAYSSKSNLKLNILKTSDLKILTASASSPEKIRLLLSLKYAFVLAEKGKLENNTVDYLGEGGLVYQRTGEGKAITVDSATFVYNGQPINLNSLNIWLKYFDRGERNLQYNSLRPIEIVNKFFEDSASGKNNWYKEYRQNPLAFLSKYCNIIKEQ
ncbi:MAG: hypothetical protein ABI723_11910 [Bacteroidia bacterium]